MLFIKMIKKIIFIFSLYFFQINYLYSNSDSFSEWKIQFITRAVNDGVSKSLAEEIILQAKFLPKVIEYDRFQPEFYEDTFTYIGKRSSRSKIKEGKPFCPFPGLQNTNSYHRQRIHRMVPQ